MVQHASRFNSRIASVRVGVRDEPYRRVTAIALGRQERKPPASSPPHFEWAPPTDLIVDAAYQRDLSPRSIQLIRRVALNWDWRRYKPPVVAETPDGFEVIDGQHTAIAAASRGDLPVIPVMVVTAPERTSRAAAFIGQNRDRVPVTPLQLHHAAVVAGDTDACLLDEVCSKAGIRIRKCPPANGEYLIGDCLAVGSIQKLVGARGVTGAVRVLRLVSEAEFVPISSGAIKSVDLLLFDDEFSGRISDAEILSIVQGKADLLAQEAKLVAATHRIPLWRGLASVIYRRRNNGKRPA